MIAPAFAIGLAPCPAPGQWLAPDSRLAAFLAEKHRLIAAHPDRVFRAEAGTMDAQREVAALLERHLVSAFPQIYRQTPDGIAIGGTGSIVRIDRNSPRLLEAAARLVADDLVIMRKKPAGWTLVAASLCFPTFWNLADKFSRPLAAIHAPVPGFAAGTRNAMMIERIFDNLTEGRIVQRANWSVHDDGALHQSHPHGVPVRADTVAELARLFLRREHQTLRKLPETGDILFTIRISIDPMSEVEAAPELAGELSDRLRELDAAELAYKGLEAARDRLADHLSAIAADAL